MKYIVKKYFFVLCSLLFLQKQGKAQSTYLPLSSLSYHTLDRIEIKSGTLNNHYVFSNQKPYTRFYSVLQAESADDANEARFKQQDRVNQYYIYKENNEWNEFGLVESKKPILKHFYKYQPDFFYLKQYSDFLLKINPLLHWELARNKGSNQWFYQNSRGVELRGMLDEKVGFYAFLLENQASFANYVHQKIDSEQAVIGEGRYKNFTSMVGNGLFAKGYDYFTARGYITYQPIQSVRLQLGHDKNFIGNGIRSLILSDNANSYFFLKAETKAWKFSYQNLWAEMIQQYDNKGLDNNLQKKYMAMHHLSFDATKWLNVGVFETVMYGANGLQLSYFNPIIFYRAIEYQLGSSDNVLVGMDYKANFLRHFSLYGQLVIDEYRFKELLKPQGWWGNKAGLQMGLKYIDVANISNLDAQIEYNTVRPYTYTHNGNTAAASNFTHYNQALTHPLGANFKEWVGTLRYRTAKNVFFKINAMYAQQGSDKDSVNYGSNIFLDNQTHPNDLNNKLLQGSKTSITTANATLSYMPRHNLFFDISYTYRLSKNKDIAPLNQKTQYFGLGMRLNLARKEFLF